MPKRVAPKTKRIGLLIPEETEYGRGVLRGIADFAKDHPDWCFRVEPPERCGLEAMRSWPADGLIVMLNRKSLVPLLLGLGLPTITVCRIAEMEEQLCVQSDDRVVGRLGAEHLLELQAASYGFVGLTEGAYVGVRAESFARALSQAGKKCQLFEPLGVQAGRKERLGLQRWLKRCPKPLALMTSNDICGRYVLGLCRELGLAVPGEVQVLGVDNEDPLSRLVWPGLSSIALATDEIGRNAAGLLSRLLQGQSLPKRSTLLSPKGVVVRGSTRQPPPDDPVLAKALTIIHESIGSPLSVGDLLKQVSVPRAALERRFRSLLDRTPAEEIRRVRIAQARRLLMATDLPVKAISRQCGFAATPRLIEAFLRETGMSPSAYRKATSGH